MANRTERDMRAGKGMKIQIGDGTSIDVPPLPINQADDWLEIVDKVSEAEEGVKTATATNDRVAIRAARRAFSEAMCEAVFGYRPDVLGREQYEGVMSVEAVTKAFLVMRAVTDPFELAQTESLRAVQRQLSDLPESVASQVLEKLMKSSGTPALPSS